MSTNEPPPIILTNESNPQTTPSNQNTSHIPLVTQLTQLTQEIDAYTDTPARAEIRDQHHTYMTGSLNMQTPIHLLFWNCLVFPSSQHQQITLPLFRKLPVDK